MSVQTNNGVHNGRFHGGVARHLSQAFEPPVDPIEAWGHSMHRRYRGLAAPTGSSQATVGAVPLIIPPALRYAVLAVVIDSVSTALPVTPGGIGAQQGLLVFALAGVATSGQVLAYSIGAQAVIMAFNVLLGLIAIFVLFGHTRMGTVRREAHSWSDPEPSERTPVVR